jgi:serpin B
MSRSSFALLLSFAFACPAAAHPKPAPSPAAEASNRFALDLYRATSQGQENRFFSPYSVSAALAMTREGAKGATGAEIDKVFHFPTKLTATHSTLREALVPRQIKEWAPEGQRKVAAYELSVANRLWGQQGVTFQAPFLRLLEQEYKAPFSRLDFKDAAGARKVINGWVAKRTKDRIKDIIKPPHPNPATVLALANAIYFKASWKKPFPERLTAKAPFHLLGGKQVSAKLMRKVEGLGYAEDADAQVVEIGYRGGDTSMVIVVPRKRDGLPALERGLTHAKLSGWLGALRRSDVDLRLPRFQFTTPYDLADTLRKMGMPLAFSGKADFRGMTTEAPLFIGAVLHKAFVAVDEKGTEAAAATVVLMQKGGKPQRSEPKAVVADHPFLFLIRHRQSGCILFLGRLTDPTQS